MSSPYYEKLKIMKKRWMDGTVPHQHELSFSRVTSGRFSIRTMDLEVSHNSQGKSHREIHRNFSLFYKSQNSEKDKTLRNGCFIETYLHFFAKRKSICYTINDYYLAWLIHPPHHKNPNSRKIYLLWRHPLILLEMSVSDYRV